MTALTPQIAVVGSFRAPLYEETLWRFFLFPLVAWGVGHFLRYRRASLVTGALVPTLFFGLTHEGLQAAFLIGLALVYVYHQRGPLPAMIVHFFTDAIPYVLVSLLTQSMDSASSCCSFHLRPVALGTVMCYSLAGCRH